MEIGKLNHKCKFIRCEYTDYFGGQTVSKVWTHPCFCAIIGSNGREAFQNDAIFNIKTLSVLVRECDTRGITAGDRLEIDETEYNINDVEVYEKDRKYYLLRLSREIITGD